MIRSTWDEWFIEEVENAVIGGLSIWYLGATGFIIRTATTTMYIDPYFGIGEHRSDAVRICPIPMDPSDATLCDAILITHEHVDHMHPPSYIPLGESLDATIHAPETCFINPDYDGPLRIPPPQRSTVKPGDTFEVGDLTMYVFAANDTDAVEPVSFVIEHASGTFYHGGDTKYTDQFIAIGERFDITLAAFAFGTVGPFTPPDEVRVKPTRWYMDGNEMIKAAVALGVERLVPTHYNLWKGFETDPKVLHDHAVSFRYPNVIEMVRVGDRLDIKQPGIVPPEWAE
ncbi:MBL fold metallo-hydrolase [Halocatena marina]|uniref:MBL fold metallo-hydrolase n=1 Tax=Halocatena marina TaxID=2934937 RepID=UPI00200FAC84|nr:MBL fold metallo-hydrolase [Halocatena marina]